MKVLQVNENKAFLAAVSVAKLFEKQRNNVSFVTEPYILYNKPAALPSGCGNIYAGESPRAAILFDKNLSVTKIDKLSWKDGAIAQLSTDDRQILLASMYFDINLPVDQSLVLRVLDYAKSRSL